MAGIADSLQTAEFFGIKFACPRYTVRGGIRDHVHEYRHTPGGVPEKLGRRLYIIEMETTFLAGNQYYPDAWPNDYYALRLQFEQETTADLVIPTIGTIKAYAIDWTSDVDFQRLRDGERVRIVFREDEATALLVDNIVQVDYASIPKLVDGLIVEAELLDIDTDIFDTILGIANDIQAIGQQLELQAEIMSRKLDSFVVACQRIDETLDLLNEPPHYKVVTSLHDACLAAIKLKKDILRKSRPKIPFIVGLSPMSVVDVAIAVYGNAARAVEVMQLNGLENPFSIPPGSELVVYAPDVLLAA